jgi:hypothetical protein
MQHPHPFELMENGGTFTIAASLENDDLFQTYHPFFEKHGYEGNGYCWEGHIIQILEKTDKSLLSQLDFDPEAGSFYAYADTREAQLRFVEILSPIFADLDQLEKYVLLADRNRIDD